MTWRVAVPCPARYHLFSSDFAWIVRGPRLCGTGAYSGGPLFVDFNPPGTWMATRVPSDTGVPG